MSSVPQEQRHRGRHVPAGGADDWARAQETQRIAPGPGAADVSAGDAPRIGPYRLVQRLGEGGMGVVHLGLDERGRAVAIKVLRDHVAHDPVARARLDREVETLRRVRHPRVAPVIDADTGGPRPYVATRYVPGDPLDVWVAAHGPLGPDGLARLGRGLAEALGAIHAAGVVHRDLKPANVLMAQGGPVVIDFGIAHVADDVRLTNTGLVMGTPGYLSPELLDGSPVDDSTDWWAWAATLLFAATGRPPFGTGPLEGVLHRVRRGEADLGGVDERLKPVLRAGLRPDAAARPRQEEILAALDVFAAGGDTGRVVGLGVGAETADSALASDQSFAHPARRRPDPAATRPVAAPDPRSAATTAQPAAFSRPGATATRPQPVVSTRKMPAPSRPYAGPPVGSPVRATPAAYVGFDEAAAPRPGAWASPPYASPPPRAVQPARRGPFSARRPMAQAAAPPGAVAPEPRVAGPRWRHSVQLPLLGLLAALAGLAMCLPVVAVLVAAGWSVVARTVEASSLALFTGAAERGRRRSDLPLAVLASPLRAFPALLTTVLVMVVSGIVAGGAALGAAAMLTGATGRLMSAESEPVLAIALVVGVLVGWWGPAGTSLRRGSRRTMRALTLGRAGALVVTVALLLVGGYFALRSQASGVSPEWYPWSTSPVSGIVAPF